MNITYMFGNGYDIQLGLKTNYKDFYNWLKEQINFNQENKIYQDIMKSASEKYEKWADFELALGKYTKNLKIEDYETREKFWNDYDELLEILAEYIRKEETNKKSQFLDTDLKNNLLNPFDGLESKYVKLNYDHLDNSICYINFLTFNYTETLKWFNNIGEYIGSLQKGNVCYKGRLVSSHGTLDNHMILGVNDESQISSSFPEEEKNDLIKSKILDDTGETMKDDTLSIIENSDFIIIFGMSLGETDGYLWKNIIDTMLNKGTYVIIHKYEQKFSQRNPRIIKKHRNQVINTFLGYSSNVSKEQLESLKQQIFVIFNKELFNSHKEQEN